MLRSCLVGSFVLCCNYVLDFWFSYVSCSGKLYCPSGFLLGIYSGGFSNPPVISQNKTYPLSEFFKGWIPLLEYLVLQLKGSQVWIEPIAFPGLLGHLRKLFVANVPTNWDIFWIFSLLDAAPALESLHVHIDSSSSAEETSAVVLDVQMEHHREYHRLKELVVIGFDGAGWQTGFVKRIMRASPRLRHVHLLDGLVVEDDDELGDLEVVPRRREWHECERSEVLDDLADGFPLQQRLEIILE